MFKYEFINPDLQINSTDFKFIESFLKITGRTQIGWHYITDIVWLYSHIKNWPRDYKVLDVGGSGGAVQFLLAEMGFNVTNIDLNLSPPELVYQKRYKCTYEVLPSFESTTYKTFLEKKRKKNMDLITDLKNIIKKSIVYQWWSTIQYSNKHTYWKKINNLNKNKTGQVKWLKGNLCNIPEIPDKAFDAVVSLSALEHIPLESLKTALSEIKRVSKPEARWAVTTSGTEKLETFFHSQSQGNCFSSIDIQKIFKAVPNEEENPGEILQKYQNNKYLRNNLARFYFKSGKNGMPWGKWDLKYIPIGLFK